MQPGGTDLEDWLHMPKRCDRYPSRIKHGSWPQYCDSNSARVKTGARRLYQQFENAESADSRSHHLVAQAAYGRASRIMLKGVSAARRTLEKPPFWMTSRSFVSPACAPRAAPTSCDSEVGTQIMVEPA